MVEIKKEQTENGYDFTIQTNEGNFVISFEGVLDLYWSYIYSGNFLEQPDYKTFTITKENYYLYSLFNKLYDDIKKYNIFSFDEIDILGCDSIEELKKKRKQIEGYNKDIKKSENRNPQRLIKNGVIEWHCDDFSYEEAGILKIKKQKENFIVTFEKSKNTEVGFPTYSVRIRTSGSRYNYLYIPFMKMYMKLTEYEYDPQISIEEYLYQKSLRNNEYDSQINIEEYLYQKQFKK